ncbi:Protein FAM198A [Acipenser ruthenus]|uniref:Protein FAM198A n=1 Tax=Acipenser ruthenus TaxID=7906 RepID=A0A444U7Q0_ACIRT|nr:Protein FAM198A [Acipenser ruthenus]
MLRVSWRAMLLCACVLGVVTLGLGLMQATHLDRRFSKQFKYSRGHRTPQHQEPRLGGQADLQKTRGPHPAPRPLEVMEDRLGKRIKESKTGSIDGMRWLGEDNEIIDEPQVKDGGNGHKRGAKEPGKQRPCLNIKEFSKKELQGLLDSGRQRDWLSSRDEGILTLLKEGSIRKVYQLNRPSKTACVVLGLDPSQPVDGARDYCEEGWCALAREEGGLGEVVQFHLDRILGVGYRPPAVARTLTSWLLPFRYTDSPKGLSWWDPTLPPERTPAGLCEGRGSCEGEGEGWPNDTSSLLLDYLLQGTDARLMVSDVQNELDSALIKHFDRLPRMSVSLLSSGCVSEKLLLSLSGDHVFWESQSLESILELVHRIETNGIALVRLVQETRRKMKL